jgi:hypothetical protein
MNEKRESFVFSPMHIDAARNATDDFNLFHDKKRWPEIHENPFGGAIALGFQLESLIEHQIKLYRHAQNEETLIAEHGLQFSNYEFTFANAVKSGQPLSVVIKKSRLNKEGNGSLNNRVVAKTEQGIVLIGYKRETQEPLFLADRKLADLGELRNQTDRDYLSDSGFFLKKKFMVNSNAKNFLSGSCAEQSDYFDELKDKIEFPEIFPCSLISCALLEKAHKKGHDFINKPMVYTSHRISIDRQLLKSVRSSDKVDILIKEQVDLGDKKADKEFCYECYGVLNHEKILYRALISLMPLAEIINCISHR